jgi:uncharacterized protein involved in response to NO
MAAIPRSQPPAGPAILSAGFRPFFLAAAIWSAVAIPLWLGSLTHGAAIPGTLPPLVWHIHEMVFGFAAAVIAGFLLTAIPSWTGRPPLQGWPLAALVLLWGIGRIAVLGSTAIGMPVAALADLAFPALFLGVVAREIVAGRNWRNLPIVAALALLLAGNLLVHLDALRIADTADLGNRIGLGTVLMLISLVGGRIIPSFTRNWLTRMRPEVSPPAGEGGFDRAVLAVIGFALALWAIAPDATMTAAALLVAGIAAAARLARWRGPHTAREPLLIILHVGHLWLAFGLLLLGASGFYGLLPATVGVHALTAGAIGTMTLAVMTRASLGHTGRPLAAGPVTRAIYVLITVAALLRLLAPFAGAQIVTALWLAGAAWGAAFALFAVFYGRALAQPPAEGAAARAI